MALKPTITREIAPLPRRSPDAHKGDAGRLVIVGGCTGEITMVGAPALAANAAFRSGAGLVQLMVPPPLQVAVATMAPCATTRALLEGGRGLAELLEEFHADAVAIGPGLGRSVEPDALKDALSRFTGPMVIDADGLNVLAEIKPFPIPDPRRIILTPHPGEMARLFGGWGVQERFGNSPEQRRAAALKLAEAFGCTIVLKGRGTVVTDGDRLYVNETGNWGMGTGGTGDVLTGIIAAFLGQQLNPLEAAILGVYLHGLAGDFAAEGMGRLCMTATDLIDAIPEAFSDHDLLEGE